VTPHRREPTGVLVVRVWREGDPPRLRGRLTGTIDVVRGERTSSTAAGRDAISAAVRRWLERFERETGGR
jgi:hypothetical protein